MTDNEIIKALGICSSEHLGCEDGCPYVGVACLGGDALLKDALALVKTKDTEIDILIRKNETLKDENFELRAEVERLKGHQKDGFFNLLGNCLVFSKTLEEYNDMRKGLKFEAIKQFAERLKKHSYFDRKDQRKVVAEIIIDHYVKEMTE